MRPAAAEVAADLDRWATKHEDLLRLVWEGFDQTGQWPKGDELTRQHFKDQPRRNYAELARLMPPQLGRPDVSDDGRIMLTPRGLSYLPSTAALLQAFVALIRHAVKRYEDNEVEAVITAAELPGLLGIEPKLAVQLESLVMLDSWVLHPAGGFVGDQTLRIGVNERTLFHVTDIETIEDYLRVELEAWYPDPATEQTVAVTARQGEPDPSRVMVVHGRDLQARNDLFALLRALGLQPIEWSQAIEATEQGAPYTGDAVDAAFRMAQAAVVLCTPDEQVLLRDDLRDPNDPDEAKVAWQPRPNVFFEGGIAFTMHPARTIVLELGRMRIASDLLGRNTIRISTEPNWRHQLAQRLGTARCAVDTTGEDWMTVGTFAFPDTSPSTPHA